MAGVQRRGCRRQPPHCVNPRGNGNGAAAAARLGLARNARRRLRTAAGRARRGKRRTGRAGGRKPFDQVPNHRINILVRTSWPTQRPPTIDPIAARHWERVAPARSPWLHEEVARRMEDRLQWIRLEPKAWAALGAGARRPAGPGADRAPLSARRVLRGRKPGEPRRGRAGAWRQALVAALARRPHGHHGPLPDGGVQMLWANMALHMAADPQALIAQWHRALATDGFLMFSCLGPDTLRELRALYAQARLAAARPRFHRHARLGRHAGSRRFRRTGDGHGANHPDLGNARSACWRNCANSARNLHPERVCRPCAAAAGEPAWSRNWRTSLRRTRWPAGADLRDHLRPCAQTRAAGASERAQRRFAAATCAPCCRSGQAPARSSRAAAPGTQGRTRATMPG